MAKKKDKHGNDKYLEEYCDYVREHIAAGETVVKICEALDIGKMCFYRWLRKYPEFKQAYVDGLSERSYDVERALYKIAQGYTVVERVDEYIESPDGRIHNEKFHEKHVKPSISAIKMVLTNRQGERWKDKTEQEITVKEIKILPPNLEEDEEDNA